MYAVKIFCGFEFGWLWLNDVDDVEMMEFPDIETAKKYGAAWHHGFSVWKILENGEFELCE